MSYPMIANLVFATAETLYMVVLSTFFAVLLGWPLGTLLYASKAMKPAPRFYAFLSALINTIRSVPFIILMVAILPFTRFLVGSSIGMNAAIVPLTLGATPFFARLVANVYQELPPGLIEMGYSMGGSTRQIILYILLPEARPAFIQAMTLTAITLVSYSAMAGTIGAGGLGTLAINYGYQRFDAFLILATVLILIVLVQGLQFLGDFLSKFYLHH